MVLLDGADWLEAGFAGAVLAPITGDEVLPCGVIALPALLAAVFVIGVVTFGETGLAIVE